VREDEQRAVPIFGHAYAIRRSVKFAREIERCERAGVG